MHRFTRHPWPVRTALLGLPLLLAGCPGGDDARGNEAPTAPVEVPQVVRSYPHDPRAFTQGLLFQDGRLLESTGRYGESSLRLVELQSGRVLQKVDVAREYFAEGLAVLGDRAYQLTWRNGVLLVYDAKSLRQTGTLEYSGEGWGLTTDGRSLIMSDGSNLITFRDPATFAVQRTLEVRDGQAPVHNLNELEWVRGELWANVWHDQRIARVDPATGRVREWLDLSQLYPEALAVDPEAVPNGIAWDEAGGRLLVTGKLWPRLYEITVDDLAASGASPLGAPAAAGPDSAGADTAETRPDSTP